MAISRTGYGGIDGYGRVLPGYGGPHFSNARTAAFGALPSSRYPSASWWYRPTDVMSLFRSDLVIPPGYGRAYGEGMDPFTAIANMVGSIAQVGTTVAQNVGAKKQQGRDAAMQTQLLQAQQQLALVGQQGAVGAAASQERTVGLAVAGGLGVVTVLAAVLLLRGSGGETKKNPRRNRRNRRR